LTADNWLLIAITLLLLFFDVRISLEL